jgi:hypothetical protein
MIPRRFSRRKFVKDLTRTRHMTLVSAVVLGTTFMPLLGLPEVYEVRALQNTVDAFNGEQPISAGRSIESAPSENVAPTQTRRTERPARRRADDAEIAVTAAELEPIEEPELASAAEPAPLSVWQTTEALEPLEGEPLAEATEEAEAPPPSEAEEEAPVEPSA